MEITRAGWNRTLSRRRVIRSGATAFLGLAGAALIGCGEDESSPGTATSSATATGATSATVTATAQPPSVKLGGSLVTTEATDPSTLDPHAGNGTPDFQMFWTMIENLVAYNRQGELDPNISLASAWEIVDPVHINFTLREGVAFHDGTPLNAEAVKYSLERVLDPATGAFVRSQLLSIEQIEVASDYELSLTLNKPNSALLTTLGDRAGTVISPAAVEKHGQEFGRNPVGTGPFVFKEWLNGDHMTVVKNPSYWGKDESGTPYPYLDEVRWNIIPDATVAQANLDTDAADLIVVPPSAVDSVSGGGKYNVAAFAGTEWRGMNFNQALAPVDDVHFRRAIAFALDKAATIAAVTAGKGTPGQGPILPSSWAFNPSIKGLDFNLDEARKELAMSKSPEGATLDMALLSNPANQQRAELQQAMLRELNINLNLLPLAVAPLNERMFEIRDIPIHSTAFTLRVDPEGMARVMLHSSGTQNAGHIPNPELDDAIDKAVETYDREERQEYYDEVQRIAIEQVYQVYTYYSQFFIVANKKVQSLETVWGGEGKQRYKYLWIDA